MYLKAIHIQNYRGIKDLTVSFNKKLNVIIGSNGCCKSTLIDAIRLFYTMGNREESFSIEPEDFYMEVTNVAGVETVNKAKKITLDYEFADMTPEQMGAYASYLSAEGNPINMVARVRLEYENDNGLIRTRCTPGNPDTANKIDYDSLQLFKSYYLGALRDSTKDLMSTRGNLLGRVKDHRDRHFYTWNMWTDVVQYEDKKNAQYHKPRKRYYIMHIDENTIKQALLKGERVTGKKEDV